MSWGVLNTAMLLGLCGAALPVIIHLLNRRRDTVIDWGAMQFLDLGRRARRRIRLAEILLMLARMGLLALVALALARPFWAPQASAAPGIDAGVDTGAGLGLNAPPRDVVLVIDGSASMDRRLKATTPRTRAVEWARRFLRQSRPGDSIAVLVAGQRTNPLIDPPSFDMTRVDEALAGIKPARGSSDIPARSWMPSGSSNGPRTPVARSSSSPTANGSPGGPASRAAGRWSGISTDGSRFRPSSGRSPSAPPNRPRCPMPRSVRSR